MSRSPSLLVLAGLLGCALIDLSGCVTQAETVSPPVDASAPFSEAGSQNVPDRWWTTFGNERLNALVDSAMASNFSLETVWQRLRASRAVVDRASAALVPDLEGSAQGGVGSTSSGVEGNERLQVGLSSVYEVDLWGQIRSSIEAEQYRAEATRADYQTAALSLSAEVVRTWYQLAEARSQLRLVEQQIETNVRVLNLIENRFETGQIRGVDVLRQRQLVESTREQRTTVQPRIQVLEHQLAVLLGRPPQEGIEAPPDTLPELPPLPETGVPVNLVRRRPDVQGAYNLLQAADREVASAISNRFPRLTLSASAPLSADNARNLFQNWAYSLGGNLLAPIFSGGALRAEVDRTEAVQQERLYQYGQTILVAFQEVEDALIREQKQREQIQNIEEQVDLASQAYEQLQVQYFNGAVDYLDVLTALDELQQLRRDLLSAELTLVEERIALYRALAGSFETGRGSEQ